jgi:hypothetical protein
MPCSVARTFLLESVSIVEWESSGAAFPRFDSHVDVSKNEPDREI